MSSEDEAVIRYTRASTTRNSDPLTHHNLLEEGLDQLVTSRRIGAQLPFLSALL